MSRKEGRNVVKIPILPNLIYRVNAIHTKTPVIFSADMEKLILQFIWQSTGLRIAENKFEKNKLGGIILPRVKAYWMFTIRRECAVEGGREA